jgi:hypothetical protein
MTDRKAYSERPEAESSTLVPNYYNKSLKQHRQTKSSFFLSVAGTEGCLSEATFD